ncbi:MAG: Zn-dependent hydrolase [Gemmatimonadota bacterium]
MNATRSWTRREFVAGVGAAWAGFGLPWRPDVVAPLRVDADRLLSFFHGLERYGATPAGGISRVAYGDADLAARAAVADHMRAAGLDVSVDVAGNLIGRTSGSADLPPLVVGSHIDSVPDGGNFDGQVGSAGALEVAHALREHGVRLRHPLEVIVFPNEEGGKTGSRALAGEVGAEELTLMTASGFSIGEGTRRIGGDPDRLREAARAPGSVAAFFELHVEQGGVLDARGVPIGVVEGIVGIRRWRVSVEGHQNHAGTTPMSDRTDALVIASRIVVAIDELMKTTPGTHVGTVGRIEAFPGAPNVIAGRVEHTLEIRDLRMEVIDQLFEQVRIRSEAIAGAAGGAVRFEPFYISHAAPTAEPLRRHIEDAADAVGLVHLRMPSGAGHDAQSMARLGPIGMIFVPSTGGISHSPAEHTDDARIVEGTEVLLNALLAADAD